MNVGLVIAVVTLVQAGTGLVQRHDLDLDMLNQFWHRTAVMALLRVKANGLKRQLPHAERVVFEQCARGARNPVTLANCVVPLLNARDAMDARHEVQNASSDDFRRGDLLSEMKSLFGELFPAKQAQNAEDEYDEDPQEAVDYAERADEMTAREFEGFRRMDNGRRAQRKRRSSLPKSLQQLHRIRNYLTSVEKMNGYVQKVNDENAAFIRSSGVNVQFNVKKPPKMDFLEEIVTLVNNVTKGNHGISVLSPKFFPLFPGNKHKTHLMSPMLFSFQEEEGAFSLPDLFKMLSIGREETNAWLDTIMAMSGAGNALDSAIQRLEPEMDHFERNVYPKVVELQRWERMWSRMHEDLDDDQKARLNQNGYAFLKADQMSRIYKSPLAPKVDDRTIMSAHLTEKQKEYRLEQDIRQLAKYGADIINQRRRERLVNMAMRRSTREVKNAKSINDDATMVRHLNDTQVSLGEVEVKKELGVKSGLRKTFVTNYKVSAWPVRFDEDKCNDTACHPHPDPQHRMEPPSAQPIHKPGHPVHQPEHHSQTSDRMGPKYVKIEEKQPGQSSETGHATYEKGESREEGEEEEEEGLPKFETLKPFAFGANINKGVVLEGLTLSPYAFFSEIGQPEALNFQVLSPRAFVPSILSPSALIARVLSPAAFRAEILSPRALHAWVLTPEALIAEVLSPKAIETRIMSPEALVIQILSPNTLAPKILSPEHVGVIVLSPSILSPHVMSSEKMMVEVLSPSILSGSEESGESGEGHEQHGAGENEVGHHGPDEHQQGHEHDRQIEHEPRQSPNYYYASTYYNGVYSEPIPAPNHDGHPMANSFSSEG